MALTLIGLTYQWALLQRFGVNILDWAEFSDFVFACIREPIVILLSLLAYLVLLELRRWDNRLMKKPKYAALYGKPQLRTVFVVFGTLFIPPLYFYSFASLRAVSVANKIKAGEGQRVTLEYNTNVPAAKPPLPTDPKPLWIGSTSRAVFLYDDRKKETLIVPQGSIARLFVEPKTRR